MLQTRKRIPHTSLLPGKGVTDDASHCFLLVPQTFPPMKDKVRRGAAANSKAIHGEEGTVSVDTSEGSREADHSTACASEKVPPSEPGDAIVEEQNVDAASYNSRCSQDATVQEELPTLRNEGTRGDVSHSQHGNIRVDRDTFLEYLPSDSPSCSGSSRT